MERISVPASGARSLDVWVAGPSEATPVVMHHGTPTSGLPYQPFVDEVTQRGLRWVSYSRPGYGDSSRQPGRLVADCAGDVAAMLDYLNGDRFYTLGGSGGGPHALACAALLPERTIAATTVAGVAPWTADGLDFLAGMGPENVEEFGAALAGQAELEPILERWADEYRDVTAEAVAAEEQRKIAKLRLAKLIGAA